MTPEEIREDPRIYQCEQSIVEIENLLHKLKDRVLQPLLSRSRRFRDVFFHCTTVQGALLDSASRLNVALRNATAMVDTEGVTPAAAAGVTQSVTSAPQTTRSSPNAA
jgi:hypothetical protein